MSARSQVTTTAVARQGGGRFLRVLAYGLLAACTPVLVAAESADLEARVQVLIRGGATQLAHKLIDQHQPGLTDTKSWMAWERQRFALYRAQRDWAMLGARVINLPADLPADFVRWARTEGAQAELQAGRGEGARRFLRELLWSAGGSRDEQALWQQLVIRSYLLDGQMEDARIAVERYRRDFRVDSAGWRLLEAGILLRTGQPKTAYVRVGEIKTHEGRLLGLLAVLRARLSPAPEVVKHAAALAAETRNKPAVQEQAWLVMAEAALVAGNLERRLYALERALTLTREHAASERLLRVQADDLWQAYERYAETVGNERRLLVGQDAAWIRQAESYRRDDAMPARAFYAFLIARAAQPQHRQLAAQRLADSLIEDGRGEVLRALYTSSARYPQLAQAPDYVRYRLTDLALAGYDIAFAGQLMHGLETPPHGEDPDVWVLRRARVLTYAGRHTEAQQLLLGIVDTSKKIGDDFAERLLQVIFDVQAAQRHADAVELLERLPERLTSTQLQREVLYWIAESRAALGEHQQAAELYLRSATWQHPTGGDMWGQTARFHAAEALGKAGLTQDARLVFQALLKHTADAKQRAVIERSIQQLWLIEKKTTTP